MLPSDVGQQLGLPDSPVNVLAAIAQGQDCMLVIDQLDATSLASGRNPQFFDCINEILFRDSNRVAYLLPTVEEMVRDPSIAVRSCVAAVVIAVIKHDRDLAVRLFEQLCDTEDVLLKTHYVERFLFYALQTHFKRLRPAVECMLAAQESEVATVGARQVCLASLFVEDARPLADRCISGTEAQQMGAAEVFAVNLRTANFRSVCEEALITLFSSPYEKVRSKAGTCFHGFVEGELST